jgi:predicted nucleic acid-binding protein
VACLIDTSILARLANTADAQHNVAVQAVMALHRRGEVLHVTSQVLVEFRNVATRSEALNGLGLSTEDAEMQAAGFEAAFPLLSETPDIYPAGRLLSRLTR